MKDTEHPFSEEQIKPLVDKIEELSLQCHFQILVSPTIANHLAQGFFEEFGSWGGALQASVR